MKQILRQVSAAMTPDGGIGLGNQLLFKNKKDLSNFQEYTFRTIMIAGFNTAQQMMDLKVGLNENRPMIVISRGRHIQTLVEENHEYIYYAADLAAAIKLAEELISTGATCANGWTICGGLKIYTDMIDAIKAGTLKLNSAYIFTADTGSFVVDMVLPVDAAEFIQVVRSSMRLAEDNKHTSGYYLKDSSGVEQRVDCTVHRLFDTYFLDPNGIKMPEDWVISIDNPHTKTRATYRLGNCIGYEVETSRNVLNLLWQNGNKTEIRLESTTPRAGLNYLEILLDKLIG